MKKPAAPTPPAAPPEERNFFQDVHQVTRLVPPGRVTSYGAIAKYLGSGRGARTVGYALMAANLDAITLKNEEPVPPRSAHGAAPLSHAHRHAGAPGG
jgi:methylated-DNA-protein-cysteine methyltransferase-like protein